MNALQFNTNKKKEAYIEALLKPTFDVNGAAIEASESESEIPAWAA